MQRQNCMRQEASQRNKNIAINIIDAIMLTGPAETITCSRRTDVRKLRNSVIIERLLRAHDSLRSIQKYPNASRSVTIGNPRPRNSVFDSSTVPAVNPQATDNGNEAEEALVIKQCACACEKRMETKLQSSSSPLTALPCQLRSCEKQKLSEPNAIGH